MPIIGVTQNVAPAANRPPVSKLSLYVESGNVAPPPRLISTRLSSCAKTEVAALRITRQMPRAFLMMVDRARQVPRMRADAVAALRDVFSESYSLEAATEHIRTPSMVTPSSRRSRAEVGAFLVVLPVVR